jgi:hypothetical protein
MKVRFALLLGVMALTTACGARVSGTGGYGSYGDMNDRYSWEKRDCELSAGYWNPNANVCEGRLLR